MHVNNTKCESSSDDGLIAAASGALYADVRAYCYC